MGKVKDRSLVMHVPGDYNFKCAVSANIDDLVEHEDYLRDLDIIDVRVLVIWFNPELTSSWGWFDVKLKELGINLITPDTLKQYLDWLKLMLTSYGDIMPEPDVQEMTRISYILDALFLSDHLIATGVWFEYIQEDSIA